MLTLADLGILRDVEQTEHGVVATITPTYSGCPAMREISADLKHRLESAGYDDVVVRTRLSPAWTTDWITTEGRRKLIERRHRAAAARAQRARRAHPDRSRAPTNPLSALRIRRHRAHCRVQRHRLQVAAPLQQLPRAVRVRQAAMTSFHELTVARVDRLTDDSAAITFDVPAELCEVFAFRPGQSVTVKRGDERRSYSICAPRRRAAAHRRARGSGRRRLGLAGPRGAAG